jgi:hypothetical protein
MEKLTRIFIRNGACVVEKTPALQALLLPWDHTLRLAGALSAGSWCPIAISWTSFRDRREGG